MPDYKQGKIYKICNNENDKCYIGSTSQPLHKRFHDHKRKHNLCMSKNLGVELKDCIIVLVEDYPCERKEQLLKRERFYIEKYKKEKKEIVNKKIPTRTRKEYYEVNKEKMKEHMKQYREQNKEKMKAKEKEYYQNNKDKIREKKKEYSKQYREDNKQKIKEKYSKKVTCECGAFITKSCLSRHKKNAPQHLAYEFLSMIEKSNPAEKKPLTFSFDF